MSAPVTARFKVGIMTLSDKGSVGERDDVSGRTIGSLLPEARFEVVNYRVLPDDADAIKAALIQWSDEQGVDLILTTGGTGLSPRDVTPQATLEVLDYEIPGMAEAMRAASMAKTIHAMLSRAVVGVRGGCLIANLPGSPKGVRENLEVLLPALPHALEKLKGDPSDCGQS